MIQLVKLNVMIGDDRTSITINPHVLELSRYLDGCPEIQDLINEAVDDYGMNPDGNVSQWVTSLVSVAATKQIERWQERLDGNDNWNGRFEDPNQLKSDSHVS